MTKKSLLLVCTVLIWTGFILSTFYVVQKPTIVLVIPGFLSITWTLVLSGLFLIDATLLGGWLLEKFFPTVDHWERILLGAGLGLGCFGFLGYGLAVTGNASQIILISILIGFAFLAIQQGVLRKMTESISEIWHTLRMPTQRGLRWVPWLAMGTFLLALLLAFAPPADDFDALVYHLTVPLLWFKDGGLVNSTLIPSYWFPNLVEGMFVWGLAFKNDTLPSLIHLAFASITIGLIWWWAYKIQGNTLAWRSMAILLTIPSLPLLASWAYTDLALAFFCVAALFTMWKSQESSSKSFWILSAVFSGLAMGIKYTSFTLPLVLVLWLAWQEKNKIKAVLVKCSLFTSMAVFVGMPWYIRNWIWTGNPFFPFVFGGKDWDAFLATNYANPGTGIGLNILKIILIPFNMTLGHLDATYFDGRMGPWWLILLPIMVWVLLKNRRSTVIRAIHLPVFFGLLSFLFWVLGVINTASLWQTRYLFPALLPLAPLAAMALDQFSNLDTHKFRISFIINSMLFLSVVLFFFDFGNFVLSRNPIPYALNIQSRQDYIESVQPAYADAISLVNQTPPDSYIYFLYEPRTYGMTRQVASDINNPNLSHDFYLYKTPKGILQAWQTRGYTHVLYQRIGNSLLEDPGAAQKLFDLLDLVAETDNTRLFKIPAP
jgi:hypothetical protein